MARARRAARRTAQSGQYGVSGFLASIACTAGGLLVLVVGRRSFLDRIPLGTSRTAYPLGLDLDPASTLGAHLREQPLLLA